jgi:hypothetical protein
VKHRGALRLEREDLGESGGAGCSFAPGGFDFTSSALWFQFRYWPATFLLVLSVGDLVVVLAAEAVLDLAGKGRRTIIYLASSPRAANTTSGRDDAGMARAASALDPIRQPDFSRLLATHPDAEEAIDQGNAFQTFTPPGAESQMRRPDRDRSDA